MTTTNHQRLFKDALLDLLVLTYPQLRFGTLLTRWSLVTKNPHAAQRQITHQRRAAKPHSTLLANAKNAWSRARQKAISKEERASHITSLMEIVRGKIQDIVFKHDASRIVQTIVKRGNQRQRDEVATELRGRFKELVENKYSKVRYVDGPVRSKLNVLQFLVAKLAHLCPSHRLSMIMEFRSHVIRLLLHREASQVIADIYELHTNATERAILLRDFYGREVALLPLPRKGEDATKDGRGGLSVVLQEASEEQRRRILASLKENLNLLLVHSFAASSINYPRLQVQQLRQGSCPTRNCPQGVVGILVGNSKV